MSECQVTLTADAAEFVQEQVAAGSFSSPAEVVTTALEQLRERQAQQRLAALLLEGLNSGPGIPVTDEWRSEQRAQFLAKLPPGTAE
jgi:antitoxin ParD1/3/4